MEQFLSKLAEDMYMMSLKMSMQNETIQIRNSRFWLPNFPMDVIQRIMVMSNNYWDEEAINVMDKYIPDDAVIVDIGAYIGSHSVYWAVERHAKKIYAFEPLQSAYEIMEKNIALNNLEDIIIPYSFGLSDKFENAEISFYDRGNIGATAFIPSERGPFQMRSLDSIEIPEKIDLIKVDVEEAEVEVLYGAIETIKRDKPVVVVETFNKKFDVDRVLKEVGYIQVDTIRENEDFVYKYVC